MASPCHEGELAVQPRGAGARWLAKPAKPDHVAHSLFGQVEGAVGAFRGGCADVIGAADTAAGAGAGLVGETDDGQNGHRRLVVDGHQVSTF